jgi:23S rRNA (cytidine1920-2'-O)/16S rRNA (cytidine1409-2'-O)-methyltransferase
MVSKERLDVLVAEQGLCATREQAQRAILAGEVWSGLKRLEKPGVRLPKSTVLERRSRTPQYVSRGGFKLAHALAKFGVPVRDRVCMDVGSSTGGFTDCLLQEGASRVFAVDCGIGQLDCKLRSDSRVSVLEKTNARFLSQAQLAQVHQSAAEISFICVDASFISLKLLVLPVLDAAPLARDWVFLFKPQFEVGPENLGKGGRVKSAQAVTDSLASLNSFLCEKGFTQKSPPLESPLLGKKSGNVEILLHYEKN